MANMPAFQASDASSILAARTKVKTVSKGTVFTLVCSEGIWTRIDTSKASGGEFDSKDQDRKVYFSKRDAAISQIFSSVQQN